jgi:hypothetical protein
MDRFPRLLCSATLLLIAAIPLFASQKRITAMSLDGQWFFAVDSGWSYSVETVTAGAHWRPISVPGSWQAQFPDLRDYQGVGWYRKSFDAPKIRRGETVILTFGAVDYRAEVYANGTRVGVHEGGYTPFSYDIGSVVHPGANEIMVRVMDPALGGKGTEDHLRVYRTESRPGIVTSDCVRASADVVPRAGSPG